MLLSNCSLGMRLLSEEKRNNIMNVVSSNIVQHFDFFFKPSHIEVCMYLLCVSYLEFQWRLASTSSFSLAVEDLSHRGPQIYRLVRNARCYFNGALKFVTRVPALILHAFSTRDKVKCTCGFRFLVSNLRLMSDWSRL